MAATSQTSQTSKRVLFVDDDPQFLEMTRELLGVFSGGAWDIITAENPSRAFAVLQDQAVDLAVIDLQMGVMDGIQMLSLLNRGYPNVQKVALTGYANENYRAACLSNGADLFLEKPTSQAGWGNLFTALNELIKFKPEEGFRGVLRRVGIQDVIQMECLARTSSLLEIANAQMQGQIFIEDGSIVHAQAGGATGEEAFNLLLSLSGGQFNVKPFSEPPARTISGSWEFLLMEAARKRDEALEAQALAAAAHAETAAGIEPRQNIADLAMAEALLAAGPGPGATTTAATAAGPRVKEMLICTAQGEVLHEWQCRHVDQWVGFFEFISQRAQRLAQALPLGQFDRLEIQSGETRAVVIISADRGVMVKTARGGGAAGPEAGTTFIRAAAEVQQRITEWLRRTPTGRGVLVRGIRFADQTFVCDFDSRDFPMGALEQAWRSVADTFQVLTAQRLPPTRLTWVYERSVLHCVRRDDGAILGVFVAKKQADADRAGLDRLFSEFRALEGATG